MTDRSWACAVRRQGGLLLLALLVLAGGGPPVCAQPADSTQLRQFRRADSYVRAGQFKEAIRLLEQLHSEAPNNLSFYRKLKDAYESVKRYEDALELVADRIEKSPSPALLSEKARLLYLKGDRQRANQTWSEALELAPEKTRTYRVVYQTLVNIRRFDKAIDVLQQGRSALDRPDLFRTELARLYSLAGRHETAMQEYVALLANAPRRATFVRNRLETFVEQGDGIEAGIRVLKDAVDDSPENRSYRELLAWLHMEIDEYGDALDVYRAIDRLANQQGQDLYNFGRKALEAREYEVATSAFSTILDRHPEAEVIPKVRLALGNTYRQWAQAASELSRSRRDSTLYANAGETYRSFLRSHPAHERYPNVLMKLGTLHLDVYRSLDEAEDTFRQLLNNHPNTAAADEGQYHLGRIALFRDSLDRAGSLFAHLARSAQEEALAERARYELALLHFYRGEFGDAVARTKAIAKNPETDVANDAIDLKVLIRGHRGPDSLHTPLRSYAKARLYDRQRHRRKALTTLDSLLSRHPRHSLADDARYRQATIHLARRDTTAALDAFEALVERHPTSTFADRSLFRIGSVQESRGHREAAIETYNRLLSNYPRSLRANDARTRLRSLLQTQG